MNRPLLLRGVDRAAFAVGLVERLRAGGVVVSASGTGGFVAALDRLGTGSRRDLYWAARLTLVNRGEDMAAFDAVFEAVFADATLGLDPVGQRHDPGGAGASPWVPGRRGAVGATVDGGGLPWVTRPAVVGPAETSDTGATIPDALPSRLVGRSDEPFGGFDPDDLRLLGNWLERSAAQWPQRRSLRRESSTHGTRVDLRRTLATSRSTSWEPLQLTRTRRRRRPRSVVLVCDVSKSMQPYASVYLHLMRATALRRGGVRPEVFAFATSLTRLTAALSHRSAEVALARANAKVGDRYGGTHLGRSLGTLMRQPRGSVLRGALVIIASDGWDADPPDVVERALARVRRRAERIIWLNPRAAAPDFVPLAGSMAAALPYCDLFLPAHSLTGLRELFDALR